MALGRGYALPFIAGKQGGGGAGGEYGLLWQQAINANVPPLTAEDFNSGQGSCLFTRGKSLYDAVETKPSLLIVPQMRGSGKLAVDIPSPVFFDVTRATTATRVNSSGLIESVASGVPRLDWYATPAAQDAPATGCPALLVEASGTNFARWVNQMTAQDTPTASGGMTITTGSTDFLAPDGTSGSITKYVGGAASGTSQYAYYSGGLITVTASGQHTFSLLVKRGATNPLTFCALGIEVFSGGSGTAYSYFNLASGTALTAGASIQNYGNGWYRLISAPYTIASGDLTGQLAFYMAATSGSLSFAASGALNLTAYTWGAQLEAGSIATTYIPTTTAAVSRAAETISASGALVSGLIGQTEGTMYFEVSDVKGVGTGTGNPALAIRDTGFTNWIGLISNSVSTPFRIQVRSTTTTLINYTSAIAEGKAAIAYSASGAVVYVNGVEVASTATNPNLTLNLVRMEQYMTFKVKSLALYTTRLSNDQLAELTRL